MLPKYRKVAALALGAIMAVSVVNVQPAGATPDSELHNKIDEVKEKKAKAEKKVDKLKEEIAEAKEEINDLKAEKKETEDDIDQLKQDIMEAQKRVERRNKLLKDRVTVMYKNGGAVNYIEVLLGSQDFSDFVSRVFALNLIAEQDKKLLEAQKEDKKQLEEDKEQMMESLDELQNQLDSMEDMRSQLEEKKQDALALVEELDDKGEDLRQELQTLEAVPSTVSQSASSNAAPAYSGSASGSVNDIVEMSRKYFGNSVYSMGGGRTQAQIQNGIFDCSGYVHWALSQIGINVGSSTSSQQHAGKSVNPSNMKPGDLVFFDTYKNNGHVGIYLGGGKFIGAQTSTGVAIADMNSGYWKRHFDGHVRRVMN